MDTRTRRAVRPLALMVVVSLWALAPATAAANSLGDEFNGPLATRWKWLNQNAANWSLTERPGWLRIRGVSEMVNACGPVENVLLMAPPAGDFQIIARVSVAAQQDYQQAGIVVFRNVDNYIKLDKLYNSAQGGGSVEFVKESGGQFPSAWPHATADLSKVHLLRIQRVGSRIRGADRVAGSGSWRTLGSATLDGVTPFRIGLFAFAGCGTGAPPVVADFDSFRVSRL